MADDTPSDEQEDLDYKPSKKPLIFAAVGALLVGLGGGFGAAMMLGGADPPADDAEAVVCEEGDDACEAALADADGATGGDDDTEAPAPQHAVVSLGKFTVNLRGGSGGRILRCQIEVEIDVDDTATVEEDLAMLRDGVILLASDYTYADLDGLDGKLRLRDELLSRMNTLAGDPLFRRVFFTEFVVQ